ncbi:putative protein with domain of unknown function (DUF3844) [Lyophyllum shimeji]|uniref:Vacuolar sorting protein Vps3844 C-terminal domain-containing protein n=1 Tax=Lyophyllum shimeji TaxID=47721 RepID=A0A9P3UL92_LYOSH|nr:putative protein with domain of unknown function (DUF3844) [Lyophyllum shimeji]
MRALSLPVLVSALQLSSAVDVYLNPPPAFLRSSLSPEHASSALSCHLGLEAFEPLRDASSPQYIEEPFVGMGPTNALLITVDEQDVKAILPPSVQPSFKLSAPSAEPVESLSSVVSTYLHRASHSFASIYDDGMSRQLEDVDALSTFFQSAETPAFAALELTKLADLRQMYGSTGHEYAEAADEVRNFLAQAYENPDSLHIALLTFSSAAPPLVKREPQASQSPLPPSHAPPHEPIGSISTCFTSRDSCKNATNTCSGRGQCVKATKAGRTCFVCACGVLKTGEGPKVKTERWAGERCERKDVSAPFTLLTGTAIVMIVLVFGSISLLSSVGDTELPSTLLATAVHVKKD